MPQFNATDAIFFGFRVIQRDPLLMIAIAVLIAAVSIVGTVATAQEIADFITGLEAFSQPDPDADPSVVFAQFAEVYGGYFGSPKVLGVLIVSILVSLVAQAAILRALVLDRREGWVMGLQIGGDELRVLIVSIAVWILVGLTYAAAVVALIVVGGVLSAVSPALGVLVAFVGIIVCMLAVALVAVRFSAAAPASVGEKKFVVFGSWRITKGRMWGLLGAYVILFFIAVVAYLFVYVVMSFAAPAATGVASGMTTVGSAEEMAASLQTPGYIFVTVLSSILSVVLIAAWSGVGAYAYRMLGGAAGYANAFPPTDAKSPPPLVS